MKRQRKRILAASGIATVGALVAAAVLAGAASVALAFAIVNVRSATLPRSRLGSVGRR
jgi:hypothetical protein